MVAFVLERPRAVLDASGSGIAPGRRSHHPRPPGAARADRAVGAAPGAARAAVAPRRQRRADGPGLRLPERERAARVGTAPQGGRFVGRTPLRRRRGALPSRHRLQPMRQRSRVPLRHLGARAGGSPPRHPLPRAGSRARAARPLREVPAMMHAAALAGFSAVLGGAIALVARQRPSVLERTRTFAFAAAAGVVAFHLLPEALPSQGVAALLWMAAGFALPWLLEWLPRTGRPGPLRGRGLSGLRVSAEVGFAALVFHSVAEGLALVAALAQPRGSLDLEIAIVAHHAPLTAAVVLPFLDLSGARAAGTRAALVAAAGTVGPPLRSVLPGVGGGGFIKIPSPLAAGAP